MRRRFVKEARVLAQLSDPNIVQFIRFGEEKHEGRQASQNLLLHRSEYIDGELLGRIIKEQPHCHGQEYVSYRAQFSRRLPPAQERNHTVI